MDYFENMEERKITRGQNSASTLSSTLTSTPASVRKISLGKIQAITPDVFENTLPVGPMKLTLDTNMGAGCGTGSEENFTGPEQQCGLQQPF